MTDGIFWGLPVILYLFLAGMGAGATTVSASMLLRGGGGARGEHHEIARYGAILGPWPVIVGTALIILELGSFEVGNYFRFINLFLGVYFTSPMSVGTWLLGLFIATSLVYAWTYIRSLPMVYFDRHKLRRVMAWVNIPLGLAVAVYTGVMLGAMPARPFWNSPVLALLFVLSALSGGIAMIIFTRAIFHRSDMDGEESRLSQRSGYILAASDMILIGFEILAIFLFLMFAYLSVGDVRYAIEAILPGGPLAGLFWGGVVLIGLILPGLIELYYVTPALLYRREFTAPRYMDMTIAAAVILGGFVLRYVVVMAGQITGPVGV